ncbi:MAG: hypothetical protein ACREHV_13975, partial [Rhizomicrobium sp.]
MLSLAGCSDDGVIYDNQATAPVSGNWQVSSTASGAALANLSGELSSSGTGVTGVLHADATTGCATSSQAIPVSGSTDDKGVTTVSGGVAGGTLEITGTLAADG